MRPENVLFVDDNELLRSLMTRFFKKEFQHITAVGTGAEAMQKVEENFYHIVILDKKLPDVDGLNVLSYIRKKSPHSRVVMITSYADEEVRQEAVKAGAFEFFEKPFDMNKLRSTLRGLRVFKSLRAKIAEKYEGVICNLSISGMLVMTDELLDRGATIDVLLHTAKNGDISLKGEVIRTTDSGCNSPFSIAAEDNRKYAVGIQLIDPPSEYFSFVDSLML